MEMLRIPDRYVAGLAAIARLSDGSARELLSVLSEAPVSLEADAVSADIAKRLTSVSAEETRDIIRTLLSLYSLRAHSESSLEDFVGDVFQAMARSQRKEIALRSEEQEAFKQRLASLLSVDTLGLSSKALDLKQEYANTFCHARILTDARPIYEADPDSSPVAAILSHTLRVSYHQGGEELSHFYVTMDGEDLAALRTTIARAEAKARSLKATLQKSDLRVID